MRAIVAGLVAGALALVAVAPAVADPPTLLKTGAASASIVSSSARILYGFTGTATVAGYYLVLDAASDPANGTVTPIDCVQADAGKTVGYAAEPLAIALTSGLVIDFSTTGCFTKTASATAFISAKVR